MNFLETNNAVCEGCESELKAHKEGFDSDLIDYDESKNKSFDPDFGNRSSTYSNETSEYYDTEDSYEYDARGYEGMVEPSKMYKGGVIDKIFSPII